MREGYTHIEMLLDRSGSMTAVLDDTIGGFNGFVSKQRAARGGNCDMTLHQFDNELETLFLDRPIAEVSDLTHHTYEPRGATALLDSMGLTIHELGTRLAAMDESQRPSRVLFVTLTDGEENASRRFSRERVFDLIKVQQDIYKWDFVFIGANQDAIKTGAQLGIRAGSTLTYAATKVGTRSAFDSLGKYVSNARGSAAGQSVAFDAEDKLWQQNAGLGLGRQSSP